jgi:hypothetical protein
VTYEPPPHLRRPIGILLKEDVETLRRNGLELPGLQAYVDRLLAPPEDDAMTRRKYLQAAASRRYRRDQKVKRAA